MKKFSIILNIVLVLVSLFFIVFANIQTGLADEANMRAERLAAEAVALQQLAVQVATMAKEAEANTMLLKIQLQECQESN